MLDTNKQEKCSLENLPEVLTAKMIAEFLDIGYVKALNLIKYGGIPYMKIGNTFRVSKKVFVEWINSYENKIIIFND